jgi:hypothetical protein
VIHDRRIALLATGGLLAALSGCGGSSTRTIVRTASRTTPAAATASTTTTTVTATPAVPVYFQGVAGPAAQRPATLELTADGTLEVERVQWSSWGGPEATGTGNALYHGCTPNCAAAQPHSAVVSVRLSDPRVCGGRRYYSGITLTLSSGALLDRQFLERSWSPC